jgi:hypothetical protein
MKKRYKASETKHLSLPIEVHSLIVTFAEDSPYELLQVWN